jgi:hypothetical protein
MRDEREKFLREKVDVQMESKEENREKRKRSE